MDEPVTGFSNFWTCESHSPQSESSRRSVSKSENSASICWCSHFCAFKAAFLSSSISHFSSHGNLIIKHSSASRLPGPEWSIRISYSDRQTCMRPVPHRDVPPDNVDHFPRKPRSLVGCRLAVSVRPDSIGSVPRSLRPTTTARGHTSNEAIYRRYAGQSPRKYGLSDSTRSK